MVSIVLATLAGSFSPLALTQGEPQAPAIFPLKPGSRDEFEFEPLGETQSKRGVKLIRRTGGNDFVEFVFDSGIIRKLPRVAGPIETTEHDCLPVKEEPATTIKFIGEAFTRLLPPDEEEAPDEDVADAPPFERGRAGWFKPACFVVGGRFYQSGSFSQVITEYEEKVTNPDKKTGIKWTPRARIQTGKHATGALPRFDSRSPAEAQVRLHQEDDVTRQTGSVFWDIPGIWKFETNELNGERLTPGQVFSFHVRFEAYAFENCDLADFIPDLPTHRFDWGIDVEVSVKEKPTDNTGSIKLSPQATIIPDPDAGADSSFGKAKKNDPPFGELGTDKKPVEARQGFRLVDGSLVREPFELP